MAGLLHPPLGAITIGGVDVAAAGPELKLRLGVVPDGLALLDHLCTEEHAIALAPLYGLSGEEAKRRCDQLILLLGLERSRFTPMASCSHGTRKKTALLLALLHAPSVLLLDEPFEGLDPTAVRTVSNLLLRLAKTGTTILFTSHALSTVEQIATHVFLIDQGRLLWGDYVAKLPVPLETFYFERIPATATPDLPWLVSGL
jgi:ABC-2 type transport system ATP-binding protein